jgi:hypothetical protein
VYDFYYRTIYVPGPAGLPGFGFSWQIPDLQYQSYNSSAVRNITVSPGNWGDGFTYSLQSDNLYDKTITVNQGSGNDTANINLDDGGSHTFHANFRLDLNGGLGTNTINLNQANAGLNRSLNIDPGVLVRLNLNGNEQLPDGSWVGGVDTIFANYRGQVNGSLDLRVLRGPWSNTGQVNATALAGSFGTAFGQFDATNPIPLNASAGAGSLIGLLSSPVSAAPANTLTVNNVGLTTAQVQNLELQLRSRDPNGVGIHALPAKFWYDNVSGAAGHMGSGTGAFLPAGLNLGGPVPVDASNAISTPQDVFVNGRRLTFNRVINGQFVEGEVEFLQNLLGTTIPPGQYYVLPNGDAGQIINGMNGPVLVNLIQAAQRHNIHPHHSVFSTYDLTGISVLGDGDFVGVLYGN